MKTAKILKKSVLTPGNNWISLLNSAKIIKKNAVTPVNFHLYHYAGNNPIKYTDPDGRETGHGTPYLYNHGMSPEMEKFLIDREYDDWLNTRSLFPIKNTKVQMGRDGRDEIQKQIVNAVITKVRCYLGSDSKKIKNVVDLINNMNKTIEKMNEINKLLNKPAIKGAVVGFIKKASTTANIANDVIKNCTTLDVRVKEYQKIADILGYYHIQISDYEDEGYQVLSISIDMKIDNQNYIRRINSGTVVLRKDDSYFIVKLKGLYDE